MNGTSIKHYNLDSLLQIESFCDIFIPKYRIQNSNLYQIKIAAKIYENSVEYWFASLIILLFYNH